MLADGPAPLRDGAPRDRARMSVAFVVPSFRRVSGGHTSIAALVRALERRGHACSIWIVPDRPGDGAGSELDRRFAEWFGPVAGAVHPSLDGWTGAEVTVATAWQTVPEVLRLPGVLARAYFVQDHEPDFYAVSAERHWSAWTYRQDLHCIATSPWLVSTLRDTYGVEASSMEFGIDHDVYRPGDVGRRDDLVVFYARLATPRRGTALGLLALEQLKRRRPEVEVAIFGDQQELRTGFRYTNLGVKLPHQLASVYSRARVGMALSFTNPSLIPKEMLACGLPCVELAAETTRDAYPPAAPLTRAAPEPAALCQALEAHLDDPAPTAERARQAVDAAAVYTWSRAAEAFEAGLHTALAVRARRSC